MGAQASDNVGKKKVYENDQIIVWDFTLEPGEETPLHRHDKSYIWYAINGGPLDCEDADGNDLGIFNVPTGSVYDIRHDGKNTLEVVSEADNGVLFPDTHKAKNVGNELYHEILIEFK